MQVEYKKEWMETYLWILPDKQTEDDYIEQMLKHNPGEGRLEFSKQEKEGETYFCYKITGKKALNSIYAVMPVGERQIREILCQLFGILENGKEFLLCEDDFVLAPNYIFATFPQMKLELCYVPGYCVPLKEQLEGLFEYLLNRVDYDDKQAVSLLYDCYMFCMKETGGLKEIKKLLKAEGKESELVLADAVTTEKVTKSLLEESSKKAEQRTGKPVQSKEFLVPESASIKKVSYPLGGELKKDTSYVSWLTGHLFPWRKKEAAMVAEEPEQYCAVPTKSKRKAKKTELQKQKTAQAATLFSEEQNVTWEIEKSEQTVLLSARKESKEPELVCEKSGEVISLTKFPFYIGSAAEYCDYVINTEGVSRIHCSISKKQDNYYLSDLNSTNGTYLNEKEIVPGNRELLSEHDEIRIGSGDFYVKFPCH